VPLLGMSFGDQLIGEITIIIKDLIISSAYVVGALTMKSVFLETIIIQNIYEDGLK